MFDQNEFKKSGKDENALKGRAKIRQGDVARLVRGAEAAGKLVTELRVEGENIILNFGPKAPTVEQAYDKWRERRNASAP